MNCHISVLLNATGDEERFWRYRASTILPLFEECNPKAYDLSVAGMAYLAAPIREHSPPTSYPPLTKGRLTRTSNPPVAAFLRRMSPPWLCMML